MDFAINDLKVILTFLNEYSSEYETTFLAITGNLSELTRRLGTINHEEHDRLESIKDCVFEIMVESQKQDIIQQQIYHLIGSGHSVVTIIDDSDLSRDTAELYSLILVLLNNMENQLERISSDSMDLIQEVEGKVKEINRIFEDLTPPEDADHWDGDRYVFHFEKLKRLHIDLNVRIDSCRDLRKIYEEELETDGGPISISEGRYSDVIMKDIVGRLTVADERATLKNTYSELDLEESSGSGITLFDDDPVNTGKEVMEKEIKISNVKSVWDELRDKEFPLEIDLSNVEKIDGAGLQLLAYLQTRDQYSITNIPETVLAMMKRNGLPLEKGDMKL